eukprot:5954903-Ditylum_brightwellii.AAC.1
MGGLLQRQDSRSMWQTGQKRKVNPWSKRKAQQKTIRATNTEKENDVEMEQFCLGMDNYFSLPHVIKHLMGNGIGVVRTA